MLNTIKATIGNKEQECVNSRELYAALGGDPKNYSRFMKDKLLKYTSFKEGKDYLSSLVKNVKMRGSGDPDVKYSNSLHHKQPNQKMLLSIINNQLSLLGN